MSLSKCTSHRKLQEASRPSSVGGWVPETLEIGLGVVCSVVTWRFTVRSETPKRVQYRWEYLVSEHVVLGDLVLNPPPELMLVSCLVFGCCVSSFVHRRQTQDAFQFAVYAVFITAAVISGYGLEASANLILLGYAPWAMCVAMATSLSGHALYRRQRTQTGKRSMGGEKALLFV
ncbi:hypothetical protein QBC34DRAFT_400247 [Podospora aff. communis PSN243]|uniref:Uncharacterized protein n=1 Tax=Podospora aff. communis PSN243 TaxID=3040156 RepID=A0AAV9GTH2_9PEZI|nr:hypothetical protein QBC34DRAFT_400247 [Podospora aff. communis PSN243]